MKLTASAIRREPPRGKSDHIEWDDDLPGFGLRIRAGGSRNFIFQYKLGDKQRRISLGSATALTVARVRKTAEEFYHRVKLGQDPASDKVEAQRGASETFGPLAEQFLESRTHYRPRSLKELSRHLTKYARPLHQLQVAKIGRRDIAELLEAVTSKSGAVAANRLRGSLSVLFSWAIQSGRIEANPVINTQKNDEQSRDRVLNDTELRLIWNALDEGDQYGAVVKLLALTGQRKGEIGGLRWSEVRDNQIVFPAERVKNRRAHVLPLSEAAAEIIAQQAAHDGRDLVFGRDSPNGFNGWSCLKELLDQRIKQANGGKAITGWRLHDLRRTCATKMVELGIRPDVVEAVLNHASGQRSGVAGIYNRHSYDREKKAALDLWADRLIAIVENRPSKVTPLARKA